MNELRNIQNIKSLEDVLGSKDISDCTTSRLQTSTGSSVTSFDIESLRGKKMKPGLYVMVFGDRGDATL